MDAVLISARTCGDEDISAGRGPGQRGWYEWAARLVRGESVLDAGCGLGYGLDILAAHACAVRGQDLDPRLASPRVHIGPLESLESKCVDTVLSVDVVEHIENDQAFVRELARLARRRVILTTPNWTASRCAWPYHIREYTPRQLRALCSTIGDVELWKGTPDGSATYRIAHPRWNNAINDCRVATAVGPAVRLLNAILPPVAKIQSHLAAVITLP